MTDLKIRRGLSTELFINGDINPNIVLEEGCWYLCTDTAELFLGILKEGQLVLKQINESNSESIDPAVIAALREEIDAIKELAEKAATQTWVQEQNFATETFVTEKISEIELPKVPTKVSELENDVEYITAKDIPKTDLSDYYNKVETETLITEAIEAIEYPTIDLSDYTTKGYVAATVRQAKYEVLPIDGMFVQYRDGEIRLNTQRVVPTHQSVGATGNPNMYYATFRAFAPEGATQCKEGLNGSIDTEYSALAIDEYGRKYTTIWAAIASYNGTGWSLFGANSNLDKYLGFYYHFEWYNEDILIGTDKVRVILTNDDCHDDLVPDAVARRIDDKIKAIDIPKVDLTGYATEEFVTDAISGKADIDHNHDDLYDAKGAAQAVKDELLNGAGEAYDTFKELGNLIDNNRDALEALETIAAGKADKEHKHFEYLTEQALDDYAKKTEIPDVTGFIKEIPDEYVTETELEAKGFITEHQDLSDYAKKSDIPTDYLKEIPAEYITESELDSKGYLTEHQSLDAYAKKEELFSKSYNDLTDKPEIPSIEGLATEEFVRTEIDKIDIPEVDLTGLVTSEQLGVALAEKANNVPFTSAKFITKPFGEFTYGENIVNLSFAEILAKLLGLTDKDPNATEPGNIVEDIIKNELPMYAITKNATLEQVPYKLLALTEENAAKKATESGFYQIIDADGNVIESGYQELQIASDEVYYVIALPKAINYDTMVSVKAWNDLESCWTDTGARKPALTSDENTVAALCGEFGLDISHIDTTVYTVWAMEGTPDGSIYRFVINE